MATTAVFLASKNREIVKSALGFIKLLIITLPVHIVAPHLNSLVPSLLGWVHDHKNHFKQKTIHIFERMIRRFGFDEVYKHAPEGGERKVLDGIKKRKDRAKKKKASKGEADDGEPTQKSSAGNAFEDILYNSDTEDESSDDEEVVRGKNGRPIKPLAKKGKEKPVQGQYIRNEGDQPMDLLSRSIAGGISREYHWDRIINLGVLIRLFPFIGSDPSNNKPKRKPGQDASHFKTDKTGKIIIPNENSDDEGDVPASRNVEGTAFMTAQRGTDGSFRDAKGNLKFNKNTKRNRADEDMMDLDEVMGEKKGDSDKKKKKRALEKLGSEFKSKVGTSALIVSCATD